ncbi:MAG: hypothetical protein KKI08_25915 [Armatimonadetes bacterium]|nr:hypothetical protein [Armatimonadota bacterium]
MARMGRDLIREREREARAEALRQRAAAAEAARAEEASTRRAGVEILRLQEEVLGMMQDQREWPLLQRIELDDAECCPFCRDRHGRIIAKTDPLLKVYLGQFHFNCRGAWVEIHRDERDHEGKRTEPNWMTPPQGWTQAEYLRHFNDLLRRYAHFVAKPLEYAAFNAAPRMGGREYIVHVDASGRPCEVIFPPKLPGQRKRELMRRFANSGYPMREARS